MRMLTLVPVFILLLAGVQGTVLNDSAYAKHRLWHCCSCGMCDSTCWCKGQTIYCTCVVPDGEDIESHHYADEVAVDIRGIRESRAFNVAKSDINESLQTLMAGTRAQGNLALKVLDNFDNGLRMWCPGSENKIQSDNTVAMKADID
jgi:hypothetical protein